MSFPARVSQLTFLKYQLFSSGQFQEMLRGYGVS
ncbi:hypothetical protein MTR67_022344 [Solanum verrucosum]|uniref:Uncharacterized protein n=1 Tax=Solanum verrucosum TaxID=315347 RepID=A0AAF0TR83_SOLVR|nr:hypothetical protein MTR67_022344 [Solanum verrucosum]